MQSLLAVAAHPDDESFLFGGALALHARRGDRVALLCLTDGQAGRTGDVCAREELGRVRRAELERATDRLGIADLFCPGLDDGKLSLVSDDDGARIVDEHAQRIGADVLLTFGPEGASGHADHKACWRWTNRAAGARAIYAATFPESMWPVKGGTPLSVTTMIDVSELGDLKRRAFLEHRTQIDHLELFDKILGEFDGKEYYHRVVPAWPQGASIERGFSS